MSAKLYNILNPGNSSNWKIATHPLPRVVLQSIPRIALCKIPGESRKALPWPSTHQKIAPSCHEVALASAHLVRLPPMTSDGSILLPSALSTLGQGRTP